MVNTDGQPPVLDVPTGTWTFIQGSLLLPKDLGTLVRGTWEKGAK